MKLSFTIRDLLWLLALVAVCVAWWFDHKPQRYKITNVEFTNMPNGHQLLDAETGERRWVGKPFKLGDDGAIVWVDQPPENRIRPITPQPPTSR